MGSKASLSPHHPSTQAAVKTEPPSQAQPPYSATATPGIDPKEPPRVKRPSEGHAANMEGASGVPDKIDEGVEEPD